MKAEMITSLQAKYHRKRLHLRFLNRLQRQDAYGEPNFYTLISAGCEPAVLPGSLVHCYQNHHLGGDGTVVADPITSQKTSLEPDDQRHAHPNSKSKIGETLLFQSRSFRFIRRKDHLKA
jgi:hypothetical protein